jgi:hypothetical protein
VIEEFWRIPATEALPRIAHARGSRGEIDPESLMDSRTHAALWVFVAAAADGALKVWRHDAGYNLELVRAGYWREQVVIGVLNAFTELHRLWALEAEVARLCESLAEARRGRVDEEALDQDLLKLAREIGKLKGTIKRDDEKVKELFLRHGLRPRSRKADQAFARLPAELRCKRGNPGGKSRAQPKKRAN